MAGACRSHDATAAGTTLCAYRWLVSSFGASTVGGVNAAVRRAAAVVDGREATESPVRGLAGECHVCHPARAPRRADQPDADTGEFHTEAALCVCVVVNPTKTLSSRTHDFL